MAALRVARPGQPVVLIDLGPAAPSLDWRGHTFGGELVSATPMARKAQTPEQIEATRAAKQAYRAANPERFREAQRRYMARKRAA